MRESKTNAVRLLEAAGIEFTRGEYEVDVNDLSGVHAAALMGISPEMVFKTLVAKGDRAGIAVFVLPVAEELDLKRAAAVSGNKSVEMLPQRELLPVTGYIRGGCSPVGMKKKYPTYIDETALLFDKISVSAGRRGLQIFINPQDLGAFLDAKFEALTA